MRIAALLLLSMSVSACSALGPEPAAEPWPTTTTAVDAEGPELKPLFTGRKAVAYRNAFRICSVFTPRELAKTYGVAARPRVVARAQARRQYRKDVRKAANRGCLDAFQNREPRA
jgi:hypothetical protein